MAFNFKPVQNQKASHFQKLKWWQFNFPQMLSMTWFVGENVSLLNSSAWFLIHTEVRHQLKAGVKNSNVSHSSVCVLIWLIQHCYGFAKQVWSVVCRLVCACVSKLVLWRCNCNPLQLSPLGEPRCYLTPRTDDLSPPESALRTIVCIHAVCMSVCVFVSAV